MNTWRFCFTRVLRHRKGGGREGGKVKEGMRLSEVYGTVFHVIPAYL